MFRVLGRFGLLAAVVVLTLCVSLLSGITSPHVDLLDVASASPADDDAVPANPLPSAPGMADPAERWDALPSAAAELPDAAMAVVAPDAAWSEVPGVPVEIRASEEATDLEAVEGGEDDVVEPVDTPPDAPDVVVAVDSLEDPALGALVIDVEQTDGVSTLDPADDGEPVPLEPTPTESPTAVPAPSETPHGDASSDGSSDGVSDGVAVEPVSQAVEVALDYSGFASLFGGGWADRLQVIAYPECYLTTPELEGCSAGVVIPSVNDVDAGSLQFTSLDLATDTTALVVEGEASISPDASESPSPSPDSESTPEPTASPSMAPASWTGGSDAAVTLSDAAGTPMASSPSMAPASWTGGSDAAVTLSDAAGAPMASSPLTESGAGTTYVVSAGVSGEGGNYGATPLAPSGEWQVGTGSGEFSYSYPFALPSALGGSAPSLALAYSSGSVDTMTLAENGQASMAGMGWTLSTASISRRFVGCAEDGNTGKGDLCWKTDGNGELVEDLTISLNGQSSKLIRVPDTANQFRLRTDPGWRVTLVDSGGAGNGGVGNADNNDEAFKVRTPDGSLFWFGYGGTNSVWTVPVFGNHAGEPCHDSTDLSSSCPQAWQWNLDRVVDPHQNITVYSYAKETNHYSRWASVNNSTEYDRGGYLTKIEYGFAQDENNQPKNVAHQVVDLTTHARCVPKLSDPSASCQGPREAPNQYPDVPVDLICDGNDLCENGTPSFFTTLVYDKVISKVVQGTSTAEATAYTVDTWDLQYAMPDPDGSGNDPADLWLDKVIRTGTGSGGSTLSRPSVNFNGVALQNRVDTTGGFRGLNKFRIDSVRTETGGRINVTYGHDGGHECTPTYVQELHRWSSSRECFAQKYAPPSGGASKWVWFHKYLVTRIELADDAVGISSGNPASGIHLGRLRVFEYDYWGEPAWRWSGSPSTDIQDENWADWRGYETTMVKTKQVGANQQPGTADVAKRRVVVFRGMHQARKNPDGDLITAKLDTQQWASSGDEPDDKNYWAGKVAEEELLDGNGDQIHRTYNEYQGWYTVVDTNGPNAMISALNSTSTFEPANSVADGRESRVDYILNDGDAEHRGILVGTVQAAHDQGLVGVSGDNTCTKTWYWTNSNPDQWIRAPKAKETYEGSCADTVGTEQRGRAEYYYDSMDPTADPTGSDLLKGGLRTTRSFTEAGDGVATKADYDTYGRVVSTTDGNGNTTITNYNPGGSDGDLLQSVKVDPPLIPATTTELSWRRGQPTKATNANGQVTTVEYDELGRTTAVTHPGTAATSETYTYRDSTGRPSRVTTSTLIEKSGGVEQRTVTRNFYDGWGRPIETQVDVLKPGATGRVVAATGYDEQGQVALAISSMYNAQPLSTDEIVNPDPAAVSRYVQTKYDGAGRPVQVAERSQGSDLANTWYTYFGDRTQVNPPEAGYTLTHHGAGGRVTEVDQYPDAPGGAASADTTASYTYTATGLLDTITSNGHIYDYDYDWLGRRTEATDPDTGTSTYGYDDNGNLTSVDDAMDNEAPYGEIRTSHDALNRPTARSLWRDDVKVGSDLVTWTYDGATLGKGLLHTVSYGGTLGQFTDTIPGYTPGGDPVRTETNYPAGLIGQQSGDPSSGVYGVDYQYNELGQVTKTTLPALVVAGAQVQPSLVLNTSYTGTGLLDTMGTGTRTLAKATYDLLNRTTQLDSYKDTATDPNQLVRDYTWDTPTGRLAGIDALSNDGTGAIARLSLGYEYDNLGNPLRVTGSYQPDTSPAQTGAWCYTYDGLQRLQTAKTGAIGATAGACDPFTAGSKAVTGANYNLNYAFDTADRTRLASVSNGPATVDYSYGDPDHPHALTTTSGAANPTAAELPTEGAAIYDKAGRITSWTPEASGAGKTDYTYDALGQLAHTVTEGGVSVDHAFDAGGVRIARNSVDSNGTTTVLYLGATEVTRTQPTSGGSTTKAVRTFATPGGTPVAAQANATWTYLLADQQHSVRLTKAGGAATFSNVNYYPYGDPTTTGAPATPSERGYLNQVHEPTGDLRLDHRTYNPSLNAFTTPDPLLDVANPQTFNPYAYSRNNPIGLSDPSGLMAIEDSASAGGGSNPAQQSLCANPGSILCQTYLGGQAAQYTSDDGDDDGGGFSLTGTLKSAGNIIVDTAEGGYYAVQHPIETVKTMAVDVKNNAVSCFTKGDVGGCVNTTLTLAGGAGVAVKAVKAARAGKRANDAAELAAKSGDDLTRVGRWMSQTEYDKMLTSGRVIEGGGGRTYVVRPPNPNTYKPGKGVYAEFDVPTSSLHPAGGNPNYAVIPGPNAGTTRFGPLPDQMPRATCIVLVCRR